VPPALPLLVVGLLEGGLAAWFATAAAAPGPVRALGAALVAWAALSTTGTGLAYLLDAPGLLGKGRFWRPLFWPYLAFGQAVAAAAQRLGLPARSEVRPGLWVGGWPRHGTPGLHQLDLTAELPLRPVGATYVNIPLLDGAPPRADRFAAAVAQVVAWHRAGAPVLVHCAYGHGRSVAVLVAAMVELGLSPRWEDAHAEVRALRPGARLTAAQRAVVAAHCARRAPPTA
jgi:hypothetical protein